MKTVYHMRSCIENTVQLRNAAFFWCTNAYKAGVWWVQIIFYVWQKDRLHICLITQYNGNEIYATWYMKSPSLRYCEGWGVIFSNIVQRHLNYWESFLCLPSILTPSIRVQGWASNTKGIVQLWQTMEWWKK